MYKKYKLWVVTQNTEFEAHGGKKRLLAEIKRWNEKFGFDTFSLSQTEKTLLEVNTSKLYHQSTDQELAKFCLDRSVEPQQPGSKKMRAKQRVLRIKALGDADFERTFYCSSQLSPELRSMVYQIYVGEFDNKYNNNAGFLCAQPALSRVCRESRKEVLASYYHRTWFSVFYDFSREANSGESEQISLQNLSPETMKCICKLEFEVDAYPGEAHCRIALDNSVKGWTVIKNFFNNDTSAIEATIAKVLDGICTRSSNTRTFIHSDFSNIANALGKMVA